MSPQSGCRSLQGRSSKISRICVWNFSSSIGNRWVGFPSAFSSITTASRRVNEFEALLNEEKCVFRYLLLDPLIDHPPEHAEACEKLGFNPKTTLIVVGRYRKVVFFPSNPIDKNSPDRSGNCLPGTVVDTNIVSSVE
ncbi:hypothetical protein BC827DRAFT_822560 [Russula dissimulans]|nr:hypothetical protein BC827DRAFT_822560 [Russula dissimulans]